jgi:putative intracellular protease/amidase
MNALGPAEIFSKLSKQYEVRYFSPKGGRIMSSINAEIEAKKIEDINDYDILLMPGGLGTRALVDDIEFIIKVKDLAIKSEYVLCVCTGSALLAKTGLLNGKIAASNKITGAFLRASFWFAGLA